MDPAQTSDDYIRLLELLGALIGLAGVLILFRWGMPFRVATGGANSLITEQPDLNAIALDHIYTVCGYTGLVCLLVGAILEIVAILMTPVALPCPPGQSATCMKGGGAPASSTPPSESTTPKPKA